MKKTPKKDFRPRFWFAAVLGALLLGLAGWLYAGAREASLGSDLLGRFPQDSSAVGMSRLSMTEPDELKRLSETTGIYKGTASLATALTDAGISADRLRVAFADPFAFADTPRGSLAIFTIRSPDELRSIGNDLVGKAGELKREERDGITLASATVGNPPRPIITALDGQTFYVADTADVILAARKETNGFPALSEFAGVEDRLPGGAHGYAFVQPQLAKARLATRIGLTGLAWTEHEERYDLTMAMAGESRVTTQLRPTDGALLPSAELATVSVQASNLSEAIGLLEEQRQETDLPEVIRLQNGISSLNRKLGVDLERDYFQATEGGVVYARYLSADGRPQWFGLAGFADAPTAKQQTDTLMYLLTTRVTVPLREEVVRVLPDGTQSRELVSEGGSPLAFVDFSVEGRTGKAATLPGGVGEIFLVVEDKYLVIGSTPDGVVRGLKSLGAERQPLAQQGQVALRAQLNAVDQTLKSPDIFLQWLSVLHPSSGRFTLRKGDGTLSGTVRFEDPR